MIAGESSPSLPRTIDPGDDAVRGAGVYPAGRGRSPARKKCLAVPAMPNRAAEPVIRLMMMLLRRWAFTGSRVLFSPYLVRPLAPFKVAQVVAESGS